MPRFNTFNFDDELFDSEPTGPSGPTGPLPPTPDPEEFPDNRVPWTFFDPVSNTTYEFPVNPLDSQIPGIRKKMNYRRTAAGNKQVISSGRNEIQQFTFSGTILTEAQFRAIESWSNIERQIHIVDDLGRGFWVYLQAFEPVRTRDNTYPWRMEYSARGVVLDWGAT